MSTETKAGGPAGDPADAGEGADPRRWKALWVTLAAGFMTLRDVPVRMAGVAGGALQTGQRLGGAVGTAALPGLFYLVLSAGPHDYRSAVAVAVGCGIAPVLGALAVAVHDWLRDRRARRDPCPPEVSHSPVHASQG